jgi:hypothetical protein
LFKSIGLEWRKTEQQLLELLLARMEADKEESMAEMDAWLEKTEAFLEKKEPVPEKTKAVVEPQEVPEGATDEETIRAAKDRSKDLRLAVGCRGKLTRIKHDGGCPGRSVPPPSGGRPVVPSLRCARGMFAGEEMLPWHSGTGWEE